MDQCTSSSMSNDFCNDIIIEILSWLPVDSLLRFKSVSRCWFSLITSPRFVKLHQDHLLLSAATSAQNHNPTILCMSKKHYCLRYMDKIVSSSAVLEKMEMISYPFHFPKHSFRIIGSCNGLICINVKPADEHVRVENEILCLWNPFTKEFKLLPSHVDDAPFEFPPYHGDGRRRIGITTKYGFGYDYVTNDYKVISSVQLFTLIEFADDQDDMYHHELKVYTLRTNSWRTIHGTPYEPEWYRSKTSTWSYVNGAFHRIAQVSKSDLRILSFDIVEEMYREVAKPNWLHGRYEWELTVLRGCLCLYVRKFSSIIEVWMMMDYGVKESWTKLFQTTSIVESYLMKPVWYCGNGDVVMNGYSKLVIYDPKRDQAKSLLRYSQPCSSNVTDDLWLETEIYIGSLVSLFSSDELLYDDDNEVMKMRTSWMKLKISKCES